VAPDLKKATQFVKQIDGCGLLLLTRRAERNLGFLTRHDVVNLQMIQTSARDNNCNVPLTYLNREAPGVRRQEPSLTEWLRARGEEQGYAAHWVPSKPFLMWR